MTRCRLLVSKLHIPCFDRSDVEDPTLDVAVLDSFDGAPAQGSGTLLRGFAAFRSKVASNSILFPTTWAPQGTLKCFRVRASLDHCLRMHSSPGLGPPPVPVQRAEAPRHSRLAFHNQFPGAMSKPWFFRFPGPRPCSLVGALLNRQNSCVFEGKAKAEPATSGEARGGGLLHCLILRAV